MRLRGRAWVYPAPLTTDHILPGQFLDRDGDELKRFALAGIDPGFSERVQPGDFVVSGRSFGAGSGRESAVTCLKLAGVAAVIGESFSRIFFRNCINQGLAAVQLLETDFIRTGDVLEVDLQARTVTNTRTGRVCPIENLTGTSLEILLAGGIVPYVKARLGLPAAERTSPE